MVKPNNKIFFIPQIVKSGGEKKFWEVKFSM